MAGAMTRTRLRLNGRCHRAPKAAPTRLPAFEMSSVALILRLPSPFSAGRRPRRTPRPGRLRSAVAVDGGGPVDDVAGQLGQGTVVVTGVTTQDEEGIVGGGPEPLSENALGLLDDDAAVQRPLQLPGDDLLLVDRAFLQNPDRGHVDQRPGRDRDRRIQPGRGGAEQV